MTVKDLRDWLGTLPPDMDAGEVSSAVGTMALQAKRVIAYRYNDGSGCGVAVNSVGTHLGDLWYSDVEIVSVLSHRLKDREVQP